MLSIETNRRQRYVLAVLIAVGTLAWLDRNILSILLESVKAEFSLTDTQLGLLGGVAFGLFYSTLGLPVAWLADTYSRRSLIAVAVTLWSAATALCGAATGFATLFMARVGVGIGEAGASPPSQSLVSDYFPASQRASALGILYLYIPLGFVAGFLGGGWLNEAFSWRTAFLVAALPGLLLALIVRFTLEEPRRGASDRIRDPGNTPTLWSTLQYFWTCRSLRHLPAASAIHGIGSFAAAVWLPSYFARTYGLGTGEIGTWLAVAYGLGGGVGVVAGGYVTDRLVARTGDKRWYSWAPALFVLIALPFVAATYLTNLKQFAFVALLVATLFNHMFLGPVTGTMQSIAGVRQRAVAAALYLFLINVVSTGVGPLAVGVISDSLGARFGADSLRYALMAIVLFVSVWASIHFFLSAKTVRKDLEGNWEDQRGEAKLDLEPHTADTSR